MRHSAPRETPTRNKKLPSLKVPKCPKCPWTFRVALFLTAPNKEQRKCSSAGKWPSEWWSVCAKGMWQKRGTDQSHTAPRTESEYVTQRERSQLGNALVPFVWHSAKGNSRGAEIRKVASWGLRVGLIKQPSEGDLRVMKVPRIFFQAKSLMPLISFFTYSIEKIGLAGCNRDT